METLQKLTSQYTNCGIDYIKKSIVFVVLMIFVRLSEMAWIYSNFHIISDIHFQAMGMFYDILFALQFTGFLLLPFIAFYFISPVFANSIYIVSSSLVIFFYIGLIGYFAQTSIPLGSDMFTYSYHDLIHILEAANLNWLFISIGFLILLSIFSVLYYFINKINIYKHIQSILFALILVSLFFTNSKIDSEKYSTEYRYFLTTNKLHYFISGTFNYFEDKVELENKTDDSHYTQDYNSDVTLKTHPIEFAEYPFLHKEETPNVLGDYFNIDSTVKPNIILLIVESLGTAYSGPSNHLGSFTPFLDSLTNHSLYWKNCISSAGRSFQALPAILGSLPYGETGFCDLNETTPTHLSLLKILNKNGYASAFCYGGDAEFDNMRSFLTAEHIQHIIDEKGFNNTFKRMPAKDNGFSWGYGDAELFSQYMISTYNKPTPRIDVILTLSMHDPFQINNQIKYNTAVEQRIKELNLNIDESTYILDYKKEFASIMYFDDALRNFMLAISKRRSFKNTIIIITGNHRMSEIPIASQIDRFHVPLIIYSPLLKTAKQFEGVTSHFDIAPTIASLLKNSFNIPFPAYSTYIGFDLDTSSTYRSRHIYPMMRNKNEFMDILIGNNMLSNNVAYSINNTLDMEPLNNSIITNNLKQQLDYFKQINRLACTKNRLLPDSIFLKW